MEGTPAAGSAARSPPGSKTGNSIASPMQLTEPQRDTGPFLRPWPCPGEDRTPDLMVPQPPRLWGAQLQGPSVLECKVRALKEKMTTDKQGATSHERLSSKKPRCRRVRAGGGQTPSEGSSLPQAGEAPPAQNPSGVNEEEPTRDGGSRPPAPRLECWSGQSPWPPEAAGKVPNHERGLLPSCLQVSPTHRTTPGRPGEPGPCEVTDMPSLKKGRPSALQDGLVTAGDLDSTSLASEEDFVPRAALPGGLWRAGDLGAPGTVGNALSLSYRVERNRLLLQEMLRVSGQSLPTAGTPARTPSWDRAAPERSAGDMDWDSGISLQDSDQNRTSGPKPEPVLSARHEEGKHLLQRACMKARTRPLRASHDIVPTIAQGSRDGQRGPALDPRMAFACRDGLQNGNTSDSSSGESSSGQWPKPGTSPSHVRFEDESACDAESRYLERLQQRQRQVLSPALQAVGQGPLRSKPDLAHYINRDSREGTSHRPGGGLDCTSLLPAPSPTEGNQGMCQACGHSLQGGRPAEGQAPPDPRALQELQAACRVEGVLLEPLSTHGLISPLQFLPAGAGLHMEWIRETHIGVTTGPEDGDSALDSTDTSDSCRTDSEEAGTSGPSKAGRRVRGGSPRQPGSRPQGAHRWSQKAEVEPPEACHLPGVGDVEVGDEVKEGRGHAPQGAPFLREDAVPKPPALDPETASLGARRQPGPRLGSRWTRLVDSWAPRETASIATSSLKPGPSGPGRPDRAIESQESLDTDCASSPQQSHAERSVPCLASQPSASLSSEGRMPALPSSRKATSTLSHRKAALAAPRRQGDPGEPADTPLLLSSPRTERLRTCGLSPPQTQPCGPQVRHPLLALATNSCHHHTPLELQEPRGAATHEDRVERGPCGQDLEQPLESSQEGGLRGSLSSADVAIINSTGITLSLALEEPEASQEPEGGLQRTESSSGGHVPPGASPGTSAGPRPPSAAPPEGNKRKSNSIASTLGLKKLFSALSQTPRPKLGKSRSYSVEQLRPAAPGPAPHASTSSVKRAPSLQSLHLVSPSHQRPKAASFQNLHSLLSGRGDRSSLYLVEAPGDSSAHDRLAKAPPRRALSVEDVGAPSLPRTVGRVVEVFPDGTSQLQLQRSQEGAFGFCVASGNGRRDSGLYVQEMADLDTAKLYSGLLGVGDEILEVNGATVAGLGLAHIRELLAHSKSLSLRVLRQRPIPR